MVTDWIEFEVGPVPHKARKLPAMTQMKLVKRLAPTYAHFREFARAKAVSAAPAAAVEADGAAPEASEEITAEAERRRDETYAAFARALTELKDEDLEFIIRETMSSVQRQEAGGAWVNIWNRQANEPMFPDVTFNVILSIVLAVLQVEFAGFFR